MLFVSQSVLAQSDLGVYFGEREPSHATSHIFQPYSHSTCIHGMYCDSLYCYGHRPVKTASSSLGAALRLPGWMDAVSTSMAGVMLEWRIDLAV